MPRASETQLVKQDGLVKCVDPYERRHGLGKVTQPCGHTLAVDDPANVAMGEIKCPRCGSTHTLVELLATAINGDISRAEGASSLLQELAWVAHLEKSLGAHLEYLDVLESGSCTGDEGPVQYNYDYSEPPDWVRERLWWIGAHKLFPVILDDCWLFVGLSEKAMHFSAIPEYLSSVSERLCVNAHQMSLPLHVSEVRHLASCVWHVLHGTPHESTVSFGHTSVWLGHTSDPADKRYTAKSSRPMEEKATDVTEAHCLVIVNKPN